MSLFKNCIKPPKQKHESTVESLKNDIIQDCTYTRSSVLQEANYSIHNKLGRSSNIAETPEDFTLYLKPIKHVNNFRIVEIDNGETVYQINSEHKYVEKPGSPPKNDFKQKQQSKRNYF